MTQAAGARNNGDKILEALTLSRRLFLKRSLAAYAIAVASINLKGIARTLAQKPSGNEATNRAATDTLPSKPDATTGKPETDALKPEATRAEACPKRPVVPIKGSVIGPSDADYDEARKDYNGRISVRPRCILYCQSEDDVVQAIKWARANSVPVSARSGGHSYEGFSLIEDGAVIDVSRMTQISVDAKKRLATVETGATLMPFYEALWEKRLVVPAGSCATVGLGGLTLGGGFGLLSRRLGLTCDNLQAVRMVDAHGNIVIANSKKNCDLLWACKGGGGGNFGITTSYTFRAHPIGNVTVIKLRWNWQDIKAVIKAWQDWAPNCDERLTSVLTVSSKAAASLLFLGMFQGSPEEARAVMEPLVSAIRPVKDAIASTPFIEAARRFSGVTKPHAPLNAKILPDTIHAHSHPRFKNTSDYVTETLNEEAQETIIKYLTESPCDSSCVQFDCYGGAINRIPVKDTAFCHRGNTKFCLHYQISWRRTDQDSKNMQWVDDFRRAMQPYVSGFAYGNYCDRAIDKWAHAYYGDNLDRLLYIKKKYDPENFFRSPQGLGTKA